jgi:predicted nucleic acid-binding protein
MRYLLDTGILLRIINREAAMHDQIRRAVRLLKAQGHIVVTTFQNVSEFWNVCTRPVEARGGLGLTLDETRRRLRTIERITTILPDSAETYACWKQLVLDHGVRGTQVHDAKLVAMMSVHGITHLLTLNPGDFARYPGVTALTPEQVIAASPSEQPSAEAIDAG